MSVTEAARLLNLSDRQVRRLRAAAREAGPAALMHGNRGRPSPRRISDELRAQVDRKSTRLNSSHIQKSRMPSSA